MKFPIGAMTMGDILDRGLRVFLARVGTFFAINLITLTPLFAVQLAAPSLQLRILASLERGPAGLGRGLAYFGAMLVGMFVSSLIAYVGYGAVTRVVAQEFVDEHETVGSALKYALGYFGKLLVTSFLSGLIVVFGLLFVCLLCIPGIIFMIWYIFDVQTVIVEGKSGIRALARSKQLTEGFRWRIFGMLLLLLCLRFGVFAVFFVFQLLYPSYNAMPGDAGMMRLVPIVPNFYINSLLAFSVSTLIETYYSICWTLFYFDLRIRKEGFDLLMLAKPRPDITLA